MSGFRSMSAAKCRKVCPDAAAQVEKARANARFLGQHHKQLVRRYPNQWVAIAHGRVVGHDADPEKLAEEVSRAGLKPADTLTHFMSETQHIFIL